MAAETFLQHTVRPCVC